MNNQASFFEKVAFVTGAGAGIGRATALAFARAGASVVVVSKSADNTNETARQAEALGVKALAIQCDVSKEEEIRGAIEQAVAAFGGIDFAFTMQVSNNRPKRPPTFP